MARAVLSHDDAPITLDSLIAALTTLRAQYGDLPVVVMAGKADTKMGIAYVWDRDEDEPPEEYVVLDCEEWATPEVAWDDDDR